MAGAHLPKPLIWCLVVKAAERADTLERTELRHRIRGVVQTCGQGSASHTTSLSAVGTDKLQAL